MLSQFGHPGREIQIKVAFLPSSGRRSIARTHLLAEALVDALGPVEGALAGHGPPLSLQKVIHFKYHTNHYIDLRREVRSRQMLLIKSNGLINNGFNVYVSCCM